MTQPQRLERLVAGRSFVLEVGGDRGPRCSVSDPAWSPLAEALCVAWSCGPARVVDLLERGVGLDLEGDCGWTHADDEPGVLSPGTVRAYAGGARCVVTRREFDAFAAELGLALLAVGAGPASLEGRLRLLAGGRP